MSYQWYRSESSPAAGSVVGTSDHTPSLMLTDLVSGLYNFTLEVVNKNGVKNSDSVMLTVLEGKTDRHTDRLDRQTNRLVLLCQF